MFTLLIAAKEPPLCWAALWLTLGFSLVLLVFNPYGRQPNGKWVLNENPNKDDNNDETDK
jgi:hypothetical protein